MRISLFLYCLGTKKNGPCCLHFHHLRLRRMRRRCPHGYGGAASFTEGSSHGTSIFGVQGPEQGEAANTFIPISIYPTDPRTPHLLTALYPSRSCVGLQVDYVHDPGIQLSEDSQGHVAHGLASFFNGPGVTKYVMQ